MSVRPEKKSRKTFYVHFYMGVKPTLFLSIESVLRFKGLTEHSEVAQYVTVLPEDGMIT